MLPHIRACRRTCVQHRWPRLVLGIIKAKPWHTRTHVGLVILVQQVGSETQQARGPQQAREELRHVAQPLQEGVAALRRAQPVRPELQEKRAGAVFVQTLRRVHTEAGGDLIHGLDVLGLGRRWMGGEGQTVRKEKGGECTPTSAAMRERMYSGQRTHNKRHERNTTRKGSHGEADCGVDSKFYSAWCIRKRKKNDGRACE